MAIPQNKQSLINEIHESYQKLQAELSLIPADYTTVKALEGHKSNTWISINDLLAYLIGWGQLVLKWHEKMNKGLEVDFPETGYRWNELGELAQKFYADFEKDDFPALYQKLEETNQAILDLINSQTDDALYAKAWYKKWTLGRMIQLNTASPYKNARIRIRKWKKFHQMAKFN